LRIRSLNKGIPGIASTSASVWRINHELGGFSVKRKSGIRTIAEVNGTLRKENDNSTFIQFEYRVDPQSLFIFYLCFIGGTVGFVGSYIDKRFSLLGVILGMGFMILVGINLIGFSIRLSRSVRRVLS
jgi:hypothetical protein